MSADDTQTIPDAAGPFVEYWTSLNNALKHEAWFARAQATLMPVLTQFESRADVDRLMSRLPVDSAALPPGWFVNVQTFSQTAKGTNDDAALEQHQGVVSSPPTVKVHSRQKGKCLIAGRSIAAGEHITVEASVLECCQMPNAYQQAAAAAHRETAAAALALQRYSSLREEEREDHDRRRDEAKRSTLGLPPLPTGDGAIAQRKRLLLGTRIEERALSEAAGIIQSISALTSPAISALLFDTLGPQWVASLVYRLVRECLLSPPHTRLSSSNHDGTKTPTAQLIERMTAPDGDWACCAELVHDEKSALSEEQRSIIEKRQHQCRITAEFIVQALQTYSGQSCRASLKRPAPWLGVTLLQGSGLLDMKRMIRLIDVLSCNAMEVAVPGLLRRNAVFEFSRLFEHECRPSCSVSFLDNPLLHGSSAYSSRTHLQRDDAISGALLNGFLEMALSEGKHGTGLATLEKLPVATSSNNNKDSSSAAATSAPTKKNLASYCSPTHIITRPCIVSVSTLLSLAPGEPLSIPYISSIFMPQQQRQDELFKRYLFVCACKWCSGLAPDLSRAFRCPKCEQGHGVICPAGDGRKFSLWECIQCGYHPTIDEINQFTDREENLLRVKADKAQGIARLVGDASLHYSHWIVLRKLDEWAERTWKLQQANLCIGILETLIKCCDRIGVDDVDGFVRTIETLSNAEERNDTANAAAIAQHMTSSPVARGTILPVTAGSRESRRRNKTEARDVVKAQYLEFLGKVNHALGNAHTSRWCYAKALEIRCLCGEELTWWCRATRFMAIQKSLADLMDSR